MNPLHQRQDWFHLGGRTKTAGPLPERMEKIPEGLWRCSVMDEELDDNMSRKVAIHNDIAYYSLSIFVSR